MVEGSAEELVEVLKTVVAGIELELVLSVAPAAAERKMLGPTRTLLRLELLGLGLS